MLIQNQVIHKITVLYFMFQEKRKKETVRKIKKNKICAAFAGELSMKDIHNRDV
jgi:hypothetical protein